MPITIDKAKKLEAFVLEYFPDASIKKQGKGLPATGFNYITFSTSVVVGSFLVAAVKHTRRVYIKPSKSNLLEVTFY
jgi:hypothetical protein